MHWKSVLMTVQIIQRELLKFLNYIKTFNPLARVWALIEALEGTCKDIVTESACDALMEYSFLCQVIELEVFLWNF